VDFKTASSILRSPWLIDEQMAASYYEDYLRRRASGETFKAEGETKIEPFNPQQKFFSSETVRYAPVDAYSSYARSFTGFDGAKIAVICLDGPLMKNDWCGCLGTASLLALFNLAAETESVKQILLLVDSPGGTVDGTFSFADAISECDKPVTTAVSGYCCSAAYWIGSAADKIYATSPTDIIGSVGTQITLCDNSKQLDQQGIVVRTFTATDSSNKNAAFNKAQKGDGKLLIKTMLDPMNNEFKAAIVANRPNISDEGLTGSTYVGNDALTAGLIDGIMCIDDILEDIQAQIDNSNISNIQIDNKMEVFQKTLKAASATEFKVTNDGFALSEANLTNIEAALTAAEGVAAEAATAKADLATANAKLADANTKVIALQEQVITMGKLDGARFSVPTPGAKVDAEGKPIAAAEEVPDNVPGAPAENPHAAYETTADKDLAEMRAKIGL